MLEFTPSLTVSAQTREALKKLDKNQDQSFELEELNTLDTDGTVGLSEQELQAAGIAPEDIPHIQKAFNAKHQSDPKTIAFTLESETPSGLDSLKDFKKLSDVDLKQLTQNLTFPTTPSPASKETPTETPTEPQPETHVPTLEENRAERTQIMYDVFARNLGDTPPPQGKQAEAIKQFLAAYTKLPSTPTQSPFDVISCLTKLHRDKRLTEPVLNQLMALSDPSKTPLHPDLESQRKELIVSAVGEMTYPEQINQHSKGTCAATCGQKMLALREPAKYLQLVAALASPEGKVPGNLFPAGAQINRHPQTLKDDGSGRTLSSRLIQPAFMEYANEAPGVLTFFRGTNYDNQLDKHSGAIGGLDSDWVKGLAQAETTHLLGGLFGPESYRSVIIERNALFNLYPDEGTVQPLERTLNEMKGYLDAGHPVPIGMQWGESYHEILVTRMDLKEQAVYYLNPHGMPEKIPLDEFKKRLASASLPNPSMKPLPGKGDALQRLSGDGHLQGFYRDTPWHTYQTAEDKLNSQEAVVQRLSEDQRSLLADKFKELKLPAASLQQVLDTVESGRFTHTMLDRLQNCNQEQASKLIDLYSTLSKSVLPMSKVQEIVAAYPEKHLSTMDFSRLMSEITNCMALKSVPDDVVLKQSQDAINQIDQLIATSKTQMQTSVMGAPASAQAEAKPLSNKEILAQFATLKSKGRYEDIEQLASMADVGTKLAMLKDLIKDRISPIEEKAIGVIIGNSTPQQQNQILNQLNLKNLGSQMHSADRAAEVLSVISKAGFDPQVLEQHMNRFFDGISSQSWALNLFNKDDDTALSLIRRLDATALKGLPESTKLKFFQALDNGSTNEIEYQAMGRLAQQSAPATKAGMIAAMMDGDTSARAESLIHHIIKETSTETQNGSSERLELIKKLDAVKLADELESDQEAGSVAALMAEAYQKAGQSPIKGKFDDFTRMLAYQHRDKALRQMIDHPSMQRSQRALYQALAPETLKQIMAYLMDGNTNQAQEDTIMKIFANSSPQQYRALLTGDAVFRQRLADELEPGAIQQLDKWTDQLGQSRRN